MKKVMLAMFLFALCGLLIAVQSDLQKPDHETKDMMKAIGPKALVPHNVHNQRVDGSSVPEWQFATEPADLGTTYYDYFPGGYTGFPVQTISQGEGDYPGSYILYQAVPSSATGALRSVYWRFIGEQNLSGRVTSQTIREGFPSVDTDPATNDQIVVFHYNADADAENEDGLTMNPYGWGDPNMWTRSIYKVIDTNDLYTAGIVPYSDDEFIWPKVQIGGSPLGADYRRAYILASNATGHHTIDGDTAASENCLLAYTDFNSTDLDDPGLLDPTTNTNITWHYMMVPYMVDWNNATNQWIRPMFTTFAHNNIVGVIGHRYGDDSENWTNADEELFCIMSENYGAAGSWNLYTGQGEASTTDCLTPEPDDFTDMTDTYLGIASSGHFNVVIDDTNTLHFPVNYYVCGTSDGAPGYVLTNLSGTTDMKFDLDSHTFLYPQSVYPYAPAGQHYLPWDWNFDGVADSTYIGTLPLSYYSAASTDAFTYNSIQMTNNPETGWMAMAWVDCYRAYQAGQGTEGYEDWANQTQVAVACSKDNGATWSDPIWLSANTEDATPAFDGFIPGYVGMGNKIEDMGNGWGRVHMMMLDDNSWGSYIQETPAGDNLGGTVKYFSIDVDFGGINTATNDNHNNTPASKLVAKNYPNPFNPVTNINFDMPKAGNVNVSIYNVKGQRVNTLFNGTQAAGNHTMVWNGTDHNGKTVASGVYFYKISTSENTIMNKMLMLK